MITRGDQRNRWERMLGAPLGVDLAEALEGEKARYDDPALYVYLCAGTMDIVRPATAVTVFEDNVVLSYHGAPVASYARRDVSFCSNTEVPPFSY